MAILRSPYPTWQCPIEEVTGIWLANIPAFHTNLTKVPPDHNLQLVVSGSYQLRINDQPYSIVPGSIIYYYKSEDVYWLKNDEPVSFYSFVFKGLGITPLPINCRVMQASVELATEFKNIHQTALSSNDFLGQIIVFSGLLKILKELHFHFKPKEEVAGSDLWQLVESKLLGEENYRPSMIDMQKVSGYSRATLYRNCLDIYGVPPAKRFRDLRLAKAQFLLRYTPLSISQVSAYLGYPRVHEFSREFSMLTKQTPSLYRANTD